MSKTVGSGLRPSQGMDPLRPSTTSSTNNCRPSRSSSTSRVRGGSRDPSTCPSPTNPDKKIPPIKAPVGLAKGPDLKHVRSKIGSLDNVKHRPAGGEKKALTQKLDWNTKSKIGSKIGSLDNSKHKPGGGDVRVSSQKLEWKVESKVGSLDNVKHRPGGGQVQIFDEKYTRPPRSMSEARGPNLGGSPTPGQDAIDSSKQASPTTPGAIPKIPQNEKATSTSTNNTTTNIEKPIGPINKPPLAPKPAIRKLSNDSSSVHNGR